MGPWSWRGHRSWSCTWRVQPGSRRSLTSLVSYRSTPCDTRLFWRYLGAAGRPGAGLCGRGAAPAGRLSPCHGEELFPQRKPAPLLPAGSTGAGRRLGAARRGRCGPGPAPARAPPADAAPPRPGPAPRRQRSGHEAGAALPAGDPGPAAAAHRVSAAAGQEPPPPPLLGPGRRGSRAAPAAAPGPCSPAALAPPGQPARPPARRQRRALAGHRQGSRLPQPGPGLAGSLGLNWQHRGRSRRKVWFYWCH